MIGHWDDAPAGRREYGHIRGRWRDLGALVGSQRVGVRLIDVDADSFSTPVHAHGGEEEVFYVLRGDGVAVQDEQAFAVSAGDVIAYPPGPVAHTLRAGADGVTVLAFGERRDAAVCYLPRVGVAWADPTWVDAGGTHPFAREQAAGPPLLGAVQATRPANIITTADAPTAFGGAVRQLGAGAGTTRTGLNLVTLAASSRGAPAHCHSSEEELFVILDGAATLRLGGDTAALVAGSVVSRPAGSGVSHAIEAATDGCRYLVYGTRDPADMVYYPETQTVRLRGLGITIPALHG
jgi:uncharacterized cupin superfamily protein